MEKHIHIVCLNVPYPVNYGGVFDLFYKLVALHQSGIKIHLHCFEYGRGEQPVLDQYCESVHYYNRTAALKSFSFWYPYIVKSRDSEQLLNRLALDDFPILMEGIHCTFLLNDDRFKHRSCFVRLHNIEHIYYKHLSYFTASFPRKVYYFLESILLLGYEKLILNKATYLSVTHKDAEEYKKLGAANVQFLPLFLPDWQVSAKEGKGCFCLYHGDLSVSENSMAATWLLQEVFNDLQIPFVIAGKNPTKKLQRLVESKSSMCLIANPNEEEMQDLIAKAHINIIPSYNTTGIKLKLLNALYNGRYCVVNQATVDGSGLENACHIATDANSFKTIISDLYGKLFCEEEIFLRKELLSDMFNNAANADAFAKLIWKE